MPRRSLVSRPKGFLILACLSFLLTWGMFPHSAGWADQSRKTLPLRATDGQTGLVRAEDFEISRIGGRGDLAPRACRAGNWGLPIWMGCQDQPIRSFSNLAQAPATPDTDPEFGDPEFGEPIPWDDPMAWVTILLFLLSLVLSIILAFLPIILFVLLGGIGFWFLKRWSDKHRPKCDICGVLSTVYNAKKAKPYLNSAQQLEVDLDSVFYSVAVCPQCTRRKVFRFAAPNRLVTQCPRCHYKTMAITQQTTTLKPTATRPGEAIIHRTCRHCGHTATRTEVLSPNDGRKSSGVDAFLEDDWGLNRLRDGYRNPSEVEPTPPDDCHGGEDNSFDGDTSCDSGSED